MPPTCGRWPSRAATGSWQSARSARSTPELAVGSLRLPRRLHRPAPRPLDLRRRARPPGTGFDQAWRAEVLAAWDGERRRSCATAASTGRRSGRASRPRPRSGLMAAHADVVGMTIASECIVAAELGLAYAAICVVDNLANGIGPRAAVDRRAGSDREPPTPRSCATGWRRCCRCSARRADDAPLTVTGADASRRDGRAALRRRGDRGARGRTSSPEPGDETIDAGGAPLVAHSGQRPHPRGDDALPRLRRRPAADALAAGGDLAGRGEARAPRTSTGARASPAPR